MNRKTIEKLREDELMLDPEEEGDDEEIITARVEDDELDAAMAGYWLGYKRAA